VPSKRNHLSLKTKLASALLALDKIPYSDAKEMGETNFLALWQFHHNIQYGVKVVDEFWNLEPILIVPHRKRTPADRAIVRKVSNLESRHAEMRRRLLKPDEPIEKKRSRWPSRPFPKGRGFGK
jgi:hypothetical protein